MKPLYQKDLRWLALSLCCLFPILAVAAGTITLTGKIHAFTPKLVEIEDAKKIYSVTRQQLGPEQDKKVAASKVGSDISLTIPMDSIEQVRTKSWK